MPAGKGGEAETKLYGILLEMCVQDSHTLCFELLLPATGFPAPPWVDQQLLTPKSASARALERSSGCRTSNPARQSRWPKTLHCRTVGTGMIVLDIESGAQSGQGEHSQASRHPVRV